MAHVKLHFPLACYAIMALARAAAAQGPATVQITLSDVDGHPLGGAKVAWVEPAAPGPVVTDAQGKARLALPESAARIVRKAVTVEKEGFLPRRWEAIVYVGAESEWMLTLLRREETVVHVRDAAGRAGARVPVSVSYDARQVRQDVPGVFLTEATDQGVTDDKGDFVWVHPPVASACTVRVGGRSFTVAASAAMTVEVPTKALALPPVLQGWLVHADGTAAVDWLAAGHVAQTTILASVGLVIPRGLMETDRFLRPQADGTFSISNPGTLLALVSPDGTPFLFSLDPSSWNPPVHGLTLTVPQVLNTSRLAPFFAFRSSGRTNGPYGRVAGISARGHWLLEHPR